jgi:hypothetical protein
MIKNVSYPVSGMLGQTSGAKVGAGGCSPYMALYIPSAEKVMRAL